MVTLSTPGMVIESWWYFIRNEFPDVTLDAAVVMPNSILGIIRIGTMAIAPDELELPPLSEFARRFKGRSTNDYMLGVQFDNWPRFDDKLWQEGHYEHIIRSDRELDRIREYIEADSSQWPTTSTTRCIRVDNSPSLMRPGDPAHEVRGYNGCWWQL